MTRGEVEDGFEIKVQTALAGWADEGRLHSGDSELLRGLVRRLAARERRQRAFHRWGVAGAAGAALLLVVLSVPQLRWTLLATAYRVWMSTDTGFRPKTDIFQMREVHSLIMSLGREDPFFRYLEYTAPLTPVSPVYLEVGDEVFRPLYTYADPDRTLLFFVQTMPAEGLMDVRAAYVGVPQPEVRPKVSFMMFARSLLPETYGARRQMGYIELPPPPPGSAEILLKVAYGGEQREATVPVSPVREPWRPQTVPVEKTVEIAGGAITVQRVTYGPAVARVELQLQGAAADYILGPQRARLQVPGVGLVRAIHASDGFPVNPDRTTVWVRFDFPLPPDLKPPLELRLELAGQRLIREPLRIPLNPAGYRLPDGRQVGIQVSRYPDGTYVSALKPRAQTGSDRIFLREPARVEDSRGGLRWTHFYMDGQGSFSGSSYDGRLSTAGYDIGWLWMAGAASRWPREDRWEPAPDTRPVAITFSQYLSPMQELGEILIQIPAP